MLEICKEIFPKLGNSRYSKILEFAEKNLIGLSEDNQLLFFIKDAQGEVIGAYDISSFPHKLLENSID